MSQFYARYIPPPSLSASPVLSSPTNRKRPASTLEKPKEPKKRKVEQTNGDEVLAKYSSSKSSRRRDENVSIRSRAEKKLKPPSASQSQVQAQSIENENPEELHLLKTSTKSKTSSNDDVENSTQSSRPEKSPDRDSPDLNAKHAKVLSRFRSNALPTEGQAKAIADEPSEAVTYHDLEPIPQPEVSAPNRAVNYAIAPDWLRQPIQVDQATASTRFKELKIEEAILRNLEIQDKARALPVQSVVLPLLLHKDVYQRHDLCVSAATGSGKTLAYVLPILNSLKNRSVVKLRAVIVVPTRALVKQVVQTIESCSAGVDVKVGTAEGSRKLADEQTQLVEKKRVLDLNEWQRQRDAPLDWSTFSLEETIKQASKRDLLAETGYVTQYDSKIDILVCTPGRLIEHLQTTQGFNIDNVDWFVADEADKLINESYREWLEVVLPALKSQAATKQRDDILRSMYVDVPSRRVTKILLSATMTRDISQLLLLELNNPKLVVMAGDDSLADGDEMEVVEDQADFIVPMRLEEVAIAFKDTENKPLYLLQLLDQHILPKGGAESAQSRTTRTILDTENKAAGDTSSSGSSSESEESSSEASSSSDSESESETSSVSSLSSDSSSSSSASEKEEQTKTQPPTATPHPRVLIFTKSTEAAHRLSRLLTLLQPKLASKIATFSRSSSSTKASSIHKTRSRILHSFSTGKTPLLICTDLAARGLDIPSLEHVINYDVPSSALTYVHRVGRTARAGREGKAWTLVEHKQGKWFWETIGGKAKSNAQGDSKAVGRGNKTIQKLNVTLDQEKWMDRYEVALAKLSEDVRAG